MSSIALRVIRCSEPNRNALTRIESDILMFSLYNEHEKKLIIKSTANSVFNILKTHISKGTYTRLSKIVYVYRHGEKPEGTTINVGEFLDWLEHVVLPKFQKARNELKEEAKAGAS